MTTDATRWTRAKQLFHAALDLAPEERSAFLREACGVDDALRAEVESLLAADAQAGSFADRSALASLEPSAVSALADGLATMPHVLRAGDRLGAYEILGPVGAGGMGEVYKARDTRLNRNVAIKVLPAGLAADATFRDRFDRESKAIAALAHPNICTLHDVGHRDDTDYLVMEYLDGVTLADRLHSGALTLNDSLLYATAIASALEAAHEKGIIHRDLKPANIAITPAGIVKVLDFGLAKMTTAEATSRDLLQSPTMGPGGTREGDILGTAAYMSPEQARGLVVDKRTDVWAFGCVLYEMLSGRVAFAGATMVDTLSAVLNQEPDWAALPASLPATVRRLVRRCLEKDPKRRLHDIADARIELEDARDVPVATPDAPQASVDTPRSKRWTLVFVALLGLATLAWVGMAYLPRAQPDLQPVRMTILPPEHVSTSVNRTPAQHLALSPDGRRLAFIAGDESGRIQLWVRPLDELDARALPGTDDANYPFWSPDSRSIAFYAQGKLKRVDAAGGTVLTLCDAGSAALALGGTWNRDGIILFGAMLTGPLSGAIYRVSASGGARTPVTTLDAKSGEVGHWAPFFLPDGQHFLYLALGPRVLSPLGIYVGSLNSTERTLVLQGGSNAKYAQGHVLFLREGTLMAQAFDVKRLELTGAAAPIAEHVQVGGGAGATGAFTVSESGVLAYEARQSEGGSQLVWLARDGKLLGSVGAPGNYYGLRLSPDERRLAVTRNESGGPFDYGGAGDLWIFDLIRGTSSRFTFNGEHNTLPVWDRDGKRLAFACGVPDHYDVCIKSASGIGEAQPRLTSDTRKLPTDWTPDGQSIIYQDDAANTPSDVWVLPLFGDRKPARFLRTPFREGDGRLSPDGRWLAFTSDQDGVTTVYVRGFPAADGPWQVSTAGGEGPRWRGDGKELFYVATDGTVMAVPITRASTFNHGAPRPLFHTRMAHFINGSVFVDYAVAGDGQRFLVNQPVAYATPITVVQNWTAGLKQ